MIAQLDNQRKLKRLQPPVPMASALCLTYSVTTAYSSCGHVAVTSVERISQKSVDVDFKE